MTQLLNQITNYLVRYRVSCVLIFGILQHFQKAYPQARVRKNDSGVSPVTVINQVYDGHIDNLAAGLLVYRMILHKGLL